MGYTFQGGIHIKSASKAAATPAKPFAEPKRVSIPLYGCTPMVAVGDFVDIGACIGFSADKGCCPVHASVSGKVSAIERRQLNGAECTFVVIENDCRHTTARMEAVSKPLNELTAEEIISRVRNAGIVDAASGAPLWEMLTQAAGKAKRIVINATDSQPMASASHRILAEQAESVIKGAKILIYTLGVRKADIAVEETETALIKSLEGHITDRALIDIKPVTPKHPIGNAGRLIYAIYNKRIGAGKTVYDTGFAVFTPETAAAVYRALSTGMPMIHRRITVDGDGLKQPCNLIVPIGTSAAEIAEFCGGLKKKFKRVVTGGALTGTAADLDTVVDKYTTGLLFLSGRSLKSANCIRCGKCIDICPIGITPSLIAAYSEKGLYGECDRLGAAHCIACGCCAYICPSAIPLTAQIQDAILHINQGAEPTEEVQE